MTPPDSGEREPNLPCPHGRASWHHCPHCLGLNAPVPDVVITEDVQTARVVLLPLPLAQRILAALELNALAAGTHEDRALADELRARLQQEPQ